MAQLHGYYPPVGPFFSFNRLLLSFCFVSLSSQGWASCWRWPRERCLWTTPRFRSRPCKSSSTASALRTSACPALASSSQAPCGAGCPSRPRPARASSLRCGTWCSPTTASRYSDQVPGHKASVVCFRFLFPGLLEREVFVHSGWWFFFFLARLISFLYLGNIV